VWWPAYWVAVGDSKPHKTHSTCTNIIPAVYKTGKITNVDTTHKPSSAKPNIVNTVTKVKSAK